MIRRRKAHVAKPYTVLEFYEACDRVLFEGKGNFAKYAARFGLDPDDAAMDFIVSMVETGRWRDYNPATGTVDCFVGNWFKRWAYWTPGRSSRARTERARRRPMPPDVQRAATPDDGDDRERLDRAMRFVPEIEREALVAVARLGQKAAKVVHDDPSIVSRAAMGRRFVTERLNTPRSLIR